MNPPACQTPASPPASADASRPGHAILPWADLVRIAAMALVIVIHATSPTLELTDQIPRSTWIMADILNAGARLCVPLFFMLTGLLMLPRQESLSHHLSHRLPRLVIPLVAWSLVYLACIAAVEPDKPLTARRVMGLFAGPVIYHLWFVYAMIGLYLLIPLLRLVTQHASRQLLIYALALWVIAAGIIPVVSERLLRWYDLQAFTGYAGYMVLGLLLGRMTITRNIAILAGLAYLLAAGFTAAITHHLTFHALNGARMDGFYLSNLKPNIMLMSAGGFIVLRYAGQQMAGWLSHPRRLGALRAVSLACFGIYLSHALVLAMAQLAIKRYIPWFQNMPLPLQVMLITMAVFFVSLAITLVMQRMPVIRHMVR